MRYVDCNHETWQTELTVNGERIRYSHRAAQEILHHEETILHNKGYKAYEQALRERQGNHVLVRNA